MTKKQQKREYWARLYERYAGRNTDSNALRATNRRIEKRKGRTKKWERVA